MDIKLTNIESLWEPLKEIHTFFSKSGIKYLIIGGIAVSLLSESRFTGDIDILSVFPEEGIEDFFKKVSRSGFSPRISDPVAFALCLLLFLPAELMPSRKKSCL